MTLRFIPPPRRADSIYIDAASALPELSGSVQPLVSPAPQWAPCMAQAGSRMGGGGYESIRLAVAIGRADDNYREAHCDKSI